MDTSQASTADSTIRVPHDMRLRNKTEYNLTKLEDIKDYISTYLPNAQVSGIQRLTGGSANHVYRMSHTSEEGIRWTSVFKHAAEQLASEPTFKLSSRRMDFEAGILEKLFQDRKGCCVTAEDRRIPRLEHTHVHAAAFGSYDRDIKLLNIEDGGTRNIKEAYSELCADDIKEIATELGKWLASLHMNTPKTHVSSTILGCPNNRIAMEICRYSYTNLSAGLLAYGHDPELAHTVNTHFGSLISTDNDCVCHGDFWPANITLQNNELGGGPYRLTVIDWELVRIGNSATDVGQFAAEAFLLDRFQGGKGLQAAFIESYIVTRARDFAIKDIRFAWMTRVAIHYAVHVAFWPTRKDHWTGGEDTETLVEHAVFVLKDIIGDSPDAERWDVFPNGLDLKGYSQWLVGRGTLRARAQAGEGDIETDIDSKY